MVNLRFSVQPAAITYPNNPQDVSTIIKISVAHDLPVVSGSGGVSRQLFTLDLGCRSTNSTAILPTALVGKMVPMSSTCEI